MMSLFGEIGLVFIKNYTCCPDKEIAVFENKTVWYICILSGWDLS